MNKQDYISNINSILELDKINSAVKIKVLEFIRCMSESQLKKYLIINALTSERRDTYAVIAAKYGVSEDLVKKRAQNLREIGK